MPYTVVPGDNLWSIWTRHGGGLSWADFKALNAHLGPNFSLIHAGDVVKLPGDKPPAQAPKPAAPKAAAPKAAAPAPAPSPSVPMQIEPGAWLALQEEMLEMERQWRAEQARIQAEQAENAAREMELRLAATPIDFVAYELYKREREEAGLPTYSGPTATDEDIQAMIESLAGGMDGGTLGVGEFGVDVPRPEAFTRAETLKVSPSEMDILGSFLRAGFDVDGQRVSYNPEDYWREVQEGFVPTISLPVTRYY